MGDIFKIPSMNGLRDAPESGTSDFLLGQDQPFNHFRLGGT